MQLSRRDAIAALGTVGVGAGAAAYVTRGSDDPPSGESGPDVETLVAAAEVLYPDEVTGLEAFVDAYARRRAATDDEHARGVRAAAAELDDHAEAWYGAAFAELSAEDRDSAWSSSSAAAARTPRACSSSVAARCRA